MSFIFPRTISVSRVASNTTVGKAGYGGVMKANESPVSNVQNLRASIQLDRGGRNPVTNLPADGQKTMWKVIIEPSPSVVDGSILNRDIITDDLGIRYQVVAPYWNSLGYQCLCERLEA